MLLDNDYQKTEQNRGAVAGPDRGIEATAQLQLAPLANDGLMGWDAKRKTTCGHRRGKPLAVPAGVLWVLRRRAQLARL